MDSENISNIFKVFLWKNFRFIYYNKLHIAIFLIAECIILGCYFQFSLAKDQQISEEVVYNFKNLVKYASFSFV